MNNVTLIGRLTRDPDITQTTNGNCCAKFTLAVDRRFRSADHPEADFISCVAWGKTAEFLQKYFGKGMKLGLTGRIQTGSYEKDGRKVYTTDVIAENVEFVEAKGASGSGSQQAAPPVPEDRSFVNVPDGTDGDGCPFK